MTSLANTSSAAPITPSANDRRHVRVQMNTPAGKKDLGTATAALRDPRLHAPERQAIANAVQAVAYFRQRYGRDGIDDAGKGFTLLLRDASGTAPFAAPGLMVVPAANPIAAKVPNASTRVLPLDVAMHEYGHLVQWEESFLGDVGWPMLSFDSGVAEGLADTAAMLATRDWRAGEGYLKPSGPKTVVRDAAHPRAAHTYQKLVTNYRTVAGSAYVEGHKSGGVVSRTFYELQQRIGWREAERLYYAVQSDDQVWREFVGWDRLASALNDKAALLWRNQPAKLRAFKAAMQATHLDEAAATSTRANPHKAKRLDPYVG